MISLQLFFLKTFAVSISVLVILVTKSALISCGRCFSIIPSLPQRFGGFRESWLEAEELHPSLIF